MTVLGTFESESEVAFKKKEVDWIEVCLPVTKRQGKDFFMSF